MSNMLETLDSVADPSGSSPTQLPERRSHTSVLRRLLTHPVGLPALVFLVLVILAVIAAPALAPYKPQAVDFSAVLTTPTGKHLLGTDQLGRDVLSRLLYGGQISLEGVAETVLVALGLGFVLGIISGYLGGGVDAVLSRLIEVVMAVPAIVILLMVFSVFNNNEHLAMLTLGVLSAPTIFRVTRGGALTIRHQSYIASAQITGVRSFTIMVRHVVPRIYGPLIVNTSILAGLTLGIQGGLNFIGLGVTPPAPSWGGMVAEAQQSLQEQPWLIVPSGVTTGLVILAFVLLGDALRDVTGERGRGSRVSVGLRAQPEPTIGDYPRSITEPTGIAQAEPLLSVRDLCVAFGSSARLRVVQDVGFDVLPGEAVGIVGESGCGKSVTAWSILGLLASGGQVTSGTALFDGVDIFALSLRERARLRGKQIGFVSQEPMTSLDPCFTVGDQLSELVRTHEKLPRAATRERVIELLTQVGLPDPSDVAKRYPHQISGGMAQRVSIAAALAGRPKLLVADEPTTALDVTVQAEILELLRTLQRERGMAILIITHDLGVVADLCSRAVVMYAGEVVEIGPVQDLVHAPLHPYTKALLASNPAFGKYGEPLPAITGTVPAPAQWPIGCHFADRCAYCIDACTTQPIPLLIPAGQRLARCIRTADLLEGANV